MKKKKCAAGGIIKGPRSMQEQLQNIRGKFADGGKVDPVEELMRKMSQKYGATPTAQTPAPQPSEPQRQPAAAAQPGQGIVGTIQRRSDELRKISDYDKPRGMQAGGIAGIDEPISLQNDAGYREPLPSAGVGAISSSVPAPTQSQGIIGGLDYSTGPKETGFVWEDGTRRDGLTPQQAQQQGASVSPVATSSPPPLLTAAEKQIAAGFNPNAAYRPGGLGDPHASGGIAATAQQRASLPPGTPMTQQTPITQQAPLPQPSRRSRSRQWYADGGMVRFAGKGGPREDKIPVKVAGESVRVSDGESAVILPAKTAANPQAVQAIGQIIRQSNDGRAPDMGTSARGAYKDGLTPAELAAQLYEERTGQKAPVGRNPLPATRGITGSFQSGATESFPAAEPATQIPGRTDPGKYPYTGQPAQNPYRDVSIRGMVDAVTPGGGIQSALKPSVGSPDDSAKLRSPVAVSAPSQAAPPDVRSLWAGTDTRDERTGLEQERARVAAGRGLADEFRVAGQGIAEGIRAFNGPSLLTSALVGDGRKPAPAIVSPPPSQASQQSGAKKIDQVRALPVQNSASTGNAGNAEFFPNNGRLSFVSKGLDVQRQQLADGTGMMHRAGDGKTILFSNMSPNQYTAADGTPNARWEQTQAYLDAQARLQADKTRLAEMQAIRKGADPVRVMAETQGMAQAAQRAPLDRSILQQQIDAGKSNAQSQQRLQAAADAVTGAKTPEERAVAIQNFRAISGKNDGKPVVVDLGDEISQDGLTKRSRGQVALDAITHQPIPLAGSVGRVGEWSSLPAPKNKGDMEKLPSGTRYVAPDGSVRIKP